MSGLTSQPSMGAVCMALEQTHLGTGIRYDDIQALNSYWSQVRLLYSCFEANVRASDSSVFDHEMPGGQYTNLMVSFSTTVFLFQRLTVVQFQASQLGLGEQWNVIKQKYIEANQLVGVLVFLLVHSIADSPSKVWKYHQGYPIVEGRWRLRPVVDFQ